MRSQSGATSKNGRMPIFIEGDASPAADGGKKAMAALNKKAIPQHDINNDSSSPKNKGSKGYDWNNMANKRPPLGKSTKYHH